MLGAGSDTHLASPGLEPLKVARESSPHPEAAAAGGREGRWVYIWGGWETSLCFQTRVFLPFSPFPSFILPSPPRFFGARVLLCNPAQPREHWITGVHHHAWLKSHNAAAVCQTRAFLFSCMCGWAFCLLSQKLDHRAMSQAQAILMSVLMF